MPNQVPLIVERQGSVLTLSLNNHSKKKCIEFRNDGSYGSSN
jgi:hypothetical protein